MKILKLAKNKAKLYISQEEWTKIGSEQKWIKTEAKKKKYKHSPKEHGFIEECLKKNKNKDNPGAYCAAIVDKVKGTTDWRKESSQIRIKLSKIQWGEIGKKAGWIKTAHIDEYKKNLNLPKIWENIPGKLTKTEKITTYSVEQLYEDPLFGTAWISISYDEWYRPNQDAFRIEKYYDLEQMQDEYGKVIFVLPNWDNPNETILKILEAINQLKS
jgi:hypothetical protein